MQAWFMRDTLEDAVIQKIRTLSDAEFALVVSNAYKVSCHVCDPREGDFTVYSIEKCPELQKIIG